MITLLGILLIILGILFIIFGDKHVTKSKGGIVQQLFSPSKTSRNKMIILNTKLLKWVFGILCICFGIILIIDGKP
jgi:hypothetical protein